MPVHPQDHAIGEDVAELRESRVALRGRGIRRHGAARERFEPHQHPQRIVGDLEHEAPVAGEREDDPRALGLVGERCLRRPESHHHGKRRES